MGGYGGYVKLYDARSLKELLSFQAHDTAAAVCFSPDGRTLATVGVDKTVALWDAATGRNLLRLTGQGEFIYGVAFHPCGRQLISAGSDRTLRMWDLAAGKESGVVKLEGFTVASLAFVEGGLLACGAENDGSVRLWDLTRGQEVGRLNAGGGKSAHVAASPDGKLLATANRDGSVRLWDVARRRETVPLSGHDAGAWGVAFSPDGKRLASIGGGAVRLWDVGTGKPIFPDFIGHESRVNALAFSSDGKAIVSVSLDETIRVWNAAAGIQVRCSKTPPCGRHLALSGDGGLLVGEDFDHPAFVFDINGDRKRRSFAGEPLNVGALAVSADGRIICLLARSPGTQLWDVATGTVRRSLTIGHPVASALALAPDGRRLAVGNPAGEILVFDLSPGGDKQRLRLQTPGNDKRFGTFVHSLAFSPDGRTLASGPGMDRVCLWEMASGELRLEFPCPQEWVESLAFHPGGGRLATGGADTTILLWDLAAVAGGMARGAGGKDAGSLWELWEGLASSDAVEAYRAVCRLAHTPAETVAFLRERCLPGPFRENGRLKELIAQLDDDSYEVRERATKALERLGPSVESVLQAAQKGDLSLEARRRIERVLRRQKAAAAADAGLRATRAVEVLELIASPEARGLLTDLSDKAPNRQPVEEAKGSLARLKERGAK